MEVVKKGVFGTFIFLFVPLMLIIGAFGEDNVSAEPDVETMNDVDAEPRGVGSEMRENVVQSNSFGVQMRFEQLKSQVDARIEGVDIIQDALPENASDEAMNASDNVRDAFEKIRDELENLEGNDSSDFRAYREEVNNFSGEFRELISDYFSEEERGELRGEVNSIISEKNQERRDRVDELRRQTNADTLSKMYAEDLNETYRELEEDYLSGNISLGQFRSSIQQEIRDDMRDNIENRREHVRGEANQRAQEAQERAMEKIEEMRDRIGPPENVGRGAENRSIGPGNRGE